MVRWPPDPAPGRTDGCFTQPKSIYDFHEVIGKLEPALKQICTHASRLPYAAHFIIQDFVTFFSRKSPKGEAYWECYEDGPPRR